MIYHAYETVPFYQGLINNIVFDIKKLPIIEKKANDRIREIVAVVKIYGKISF